MQVLDALGYDLASATHIIDTHVIARQVLNQNGINLRKMIQKLSDHFGQMTSAGNDSFHNAGNDAHLTLKALLLLAVYYHNQQSNPGHTRQKEITTRLERIATDDRLYNPPLEHNYTPEEAEKKKYRKALREKNQANPPEESQDKKRLSKKARQELSHVSGQF